MTARSARSPTAKVPGVDAQVVGQLAGHAGAPPGRSVMTGRPASARSLTSRSRWSGKL